MGKMYIALEGGAESDAKAVFWFRKAADQELPSAIRNLGWMSEKGRGVGRDEEQALKLYQRAAEEGEAAGLTDLGRMYETGRVVKEDQKEALKWYRQALTTPGLTPQFRKVAEVGITRLTGKSVR